MAGLKVTFPYPVFQIFYYILFPLPFLLSRVICNYIHKILSLSITNTKISYEKFCRMKVIVDTDIGSDIDDAIALAYLLANPQCELLGITTVTGEPEKRAMIASALCIDAGRDIPIYPGAANPLFIERPLRKVIQAEVLPGWAHHTTFPHNQAVQFIRDTIYKNPGEITLLTLGPLTNIAELFTLYPEIPSMLKSIVMMCGYFLHKIEGWNKCEWNALWDYDAADIVYKADIPSNISVGIDVTSKIVLSNDDFDKMFSREKFPLIHDLSSYKAHYHGNQFVLHDPLVSAVVFNRNLCSYRKGIISVDKNNKESLGLTCFEPKNDGRHEIAVTVNKEVFFEKYFSVFN